MDRVIVYVDDADYAQQVLAPLLARDISRRASTHWVLVACAPRMTHRISKWVSHSARENWRTKWTGKLFDQIVPALRLPAAHITTVVAKGPLAELTDELQAAGPAPAVVVDARRPKVDMATPPTAAAVAPSERRWPPTPLPGALGSVLAGFGVLWMLALE